MVKYHLSWVRWKRLPALWCSVLLTFTILMTLSLLIDTSLYKRQESLRAMQEKTMIRVTLTDRRGKANDLKLLNGVTYSFFHGALKRFVGDISIRSHEPVTTTIGVVELMGISKARYQELINLGTTLPVAWNEGYDASWLDTDEAVCVIGKSLLPAVETQQDGSQTIRADLQYDDCEALVFRVVGISPVDDAFYIPWLTLYRWSIAIQVSDFSFSLADNALLDEWKTVAKAEFGAPNQGGFASYLPAVMTHDTQYQEIHSAGQKNLLVLTIMRPVLLLCASGCGLLIGIFVVRLRQGELALLRSLGVSPIELLLQGAIEILLPCAVACLFLTLYNPGWLYAVLLTCYTVGYLFPLIICCYKPLLAQFRLLEGMSC